MSSVIVVPPGDDGPSSQIHLEPGQTLGIGRSPATAAPPPDGPYLALGHHGVSRAAGQLTATGTFWTLTNLSPRQTYVVENPEGAGEYLKVAPGRVDAPIPFEFARVVLPAGGELLSFDVWAPRHDFVDRYAAPGTDGAPTASCFPLDRTKRYFQVLTALCEPRLRGVPHAPLPTVDEVVQRLAPVWPAAGRASTQWNIDYLAVKLRLKSSADEGEGGRRLNGKKESLVSLALRFDLVTEEDLAVLEQEITR